MSHFTWFDRKLLFSKSPKNILNVSKNRGKNRNPSHKGKKIVKAKKKKKKKKKGD